MNNPHNSRSLTLCITELDVGGAEKALVRIATGLKDRGWAVRVVSMRDEGPLTAPLRQAGIEVCALQCAGFLDIRAFWRLRAELRRHPPDALLCFLHQANIYGRLAGHVVGVPLVVSGIRVADRRFTVTAPERLTQCCVHHYVAVSEQVAATHADLCGIAADAMTAIPNGVDSPACQIGDDSATDQDSHELLFVGRLTEQKDPLTLVEAFRLLPDELRSACTLTLAGHGPLADQVATCVRSYGLQDRVQCIGHSDDVPALMQRSTLLILPSRWEGMPNVVLEAMAARLPVVATSVDGTRDLIVDGQTGWLVPPESPQRLCDAITHALTQPVQRANIATAAAGHVATHFSWSAVIDQYESLLDRLLDNAHRASC